MHFVQSNDFIRNATKIQKVTKKQHKKRTKNVTACLVLGSSEIFEFQSVPESIFIIEKRRGTINLTIEVIFVIVLVKYEDY